MGKRSFLEARARARAWSLDNGEIRGWDKLDVGCKFALDLTAVKGRVFNLDTAARCNSS
jgi:hypothetical protein